ncbi:TPA: DUF645 family protein, partial [Vibrio cholerae]|nr:DUF645 family protein [Vibrio cholerae]
SQLLALDVCLLDAFA